MTATSKLGLELLQNAAANQTLANTTFAQLNQLVQPAVVDKDLAVPPSSPADEALYIVAASPSGAWAGKAGQLAYWLNATGAWQFVPPQNGFMVKVLDESKRYEFNGTAWVEFVTSGGGASDPTKLPLTGGKLTGALNEADIGTVSGSGYILLPNTGPNTYFITGTGTINGINSSDATITSGAERELIFTESGGTFLHQNNYVQLPGGQNITWAAGDVMRLKYIDTLVSGIKWRCVSYQRNDGTALVGLKSASLTAALNEAPLVTIASIAMPDISANTVAANTLNITGTTTITGFATAPSGIKRMLIFADVLTLTHNATSLILLGNANVVTAAGDIAELLSLGSGNWKMTRYTRAAVAP